ncbi:MAG: hypothetical protein A2792_13880 [Sphingomonadales bacterium RIFCSPHIGHO2_01_FULL_65_20]|jgi:hypothetical protein|uniref:DUF2939 domain-containing protein n=1 Tax=Blastomonas sp. TaxID=1909299 RepID=UPI0008CEBB10|nr:DUF2939 domain-containing protein [Blastomonas sp.]OHC93269.1 MAG: hypothetical protein A2792_13880 [Sphingomonadales bacterium RIFCSPHIGHO2_01_FULL_65_20]
MKRWATIGLVLFLALIGIYVGSPYYAVYSLRNAALDGDVDALEAKVDFPAVRESLKSQLSAAMMAKMQNDPEMQNNPFAGLGMMMMPAIVDRMVEAYVTADGIGAMVRGRKPKDTDKSGVNPDIATESEYLGLDRFRLRTRNTKSGEVGPSFVLERTGFLSWKMTRLEIPTEILQDR